MMASAAKTSRWWFTSFMCNIWTIECR